MDLHDSNSSLIHFAGKRFSFWFFLYSILFARVLLNVNESVCVLMVLFQYFLNIKITNNNMKKIIFSYIDTIHMQIRNWVTHTITTNNNKILKDKQQETKIKRQTFSFFPIFFLFAISENDPNKKIKSREPNSSHSSRNKNQTFSHTQKIVWFVKRIEKKRSKERDERNRTNRKNCCQLIYSKYFNRRKPIIFHIR